MQGLWIDRKGEKYTTNEKREKIIPVRVSLKEEELLTEKANKIELKLSTYLRLSALEK